MATIPTVSFVGRSKTGKTTLIEKVIATLTSQGIRVATIKHHHRGDFEIDHAGKDTYRHKKAGAKISMIVSPEKLALVEDLSAIPSLDDILARFVRDVDLVIAEGFKSRPGPKIEVYSRECSQPPLALDDHDLFAMVSDIPMSLAVPVFSRDDISAVCDFIIRTFLKNHPS
jgi:molybdopterin-guanine dinucleotide biosynthesis protein MobB